MTRSYKAPRTNRDDARARIAVQLDRLYDRLDQALANLQYYTNFAGDTGTFIENYTGEVEYLQDEIATLEARA